MEVKTYGKRSNSINTFPSATKSFDCVDLTIGEENLEPVIQNRLPKNNSNAMNNQAKKRKKDDAPKQARSRKKKANLPEILRNADPKFLEYINKCLREPLKSLHFIISPPRQWTPEEKQNFIQLIESIGGFVKTRSTRYDSYEYVDELQKFQLEVEASINRFVPSNTRQPFEIVNKNEINCFRAYYESSNPPSRTVQAEISTPLDNFTSIRFGANTVNSIHLEENDETTEENSNPAPRAIHERPQFGQFRKARAYSNPLAIITDHDEDNDDSSASGSRTSSRNDLSSPFPSLDTPYSLNGSLGTGGSRPGSSMSRSNPSPLNDAFVQLTNRMTLKSPRWINTNNVNVLPPPLPLTRSISAPPVGMAAITSTNGCKSSKLFDFAVSLSSSTENITTSAAEETSNLTSFLPISTTQSGSNTQSSSTVSLLGGSHNLTTHSIPSNPNLLAGITTPVPSADTSASAIAGSSSFMSIQKSSIPVPPVVAPSGNKTRTTNNNNTITRASTIGNRRFPINSFVNNSCHSFDTVDEEDDYRNGNNRSIETPDTEEDELITTPPDIIPPAIPAIPSLYRSTSIDLSQQFDEHVVINQETHLSAVGLRKFPASLSSEFLQGNSSSGYTTGMSRSESTKPFLSNSVIVSSNPFAASIQGRDGIALLDDHYARSNSLIDELENYLPSMTGSNPFQTSAAVNQERIRERSSTMTPEAKSPTPPSSILHPIVVNSTPVTTNNAFPVTGSSSQRLNSLPATSRYQGSAFARRAIDESHSSAHRSTNPLIRSLTEPAQRNSTAGNAHALLFGGDQTPGGCPGISLSQNCADQPNRLNLHFSTPQKIGVTSSQQQQKDEEEIWLQSFEGNSSMIDSMTTKLTGYYAHFRMRKEKLLNFTNALVCEVACDVKANKKIPEIHRSTSLPDFCHNEKNIEEESPEIRESQKKKNRLEYHHGKGNGVNVVGMVRQTSFDSIPFNGAPSSANPASDNIPDNGEFNMININPIQNISMDDTSFQLRVGRLSTNSNASTTSSGGILHTNFAGNTSVMSAEGNNSRDSIGGIYEKLYYHHNHSTGSIDNLNGQTPAGVVAGVGEIHHRYSTGSTVSMFSAEHPSHLMNGHITTRPKIKRCFSDEHEYAPHLHDQLFHTLEYSAASLSNNNNNLSLEQVLNLSAGSAGSAGVANAHGISLGAMMNSIQEEEENDEDEDEQGVNNRNGRNNLVNISNSSNQSGGSGVINSEMSSAKAVNLGFSEDSQFYNGSGKSGVRENGRSSTPAGEESHSQKINSEYVGMTTLSGKLSGSHGRISRQSSTGSTRTGNSVNKPLLLGDDEFAESPIAPPMTTNNARSGSISSLPAFNVLNNTSSLFGSPTPTAAPGSRSLAMPSSVQSMRYVIDADDDMDESMHDVSQHNTAHDDIHGQGSRFSLGSSPPSQIIDTFVISSPNEVPFTQSSRGNHANTRSQVVPPNTAMSASSTLVQLDTSDILGINELDFLGDVDALDTIVSETYDDEEDLNGMMVMDEEESGSDSSIILKTRQQQQVSKMDKATQQKVYAKRLKSKAKMRRLSQSFRQQNQSNSCGSSESLSASRISAVGSANDDELSDLLAYARGNPAAVLHGNIADNSNAVFANYFGSTTKCSTMITNSELKRKRRPSLYGGSHSIAFVPSIASASSVDSTSGSGKGVGISRGMTISIPEEDENDLPIFPPSAATLSTGNYSTRTDSTRSANSGRFFSSRQQVTGGLSSIESIASNGSSSSTSSHNVFFGTVVQNTIPGVVTRARAISSSYEELQTITTTAGTITAPSTASSVTSSTVSRSNSRAGNNSTGYYSPVGYPFSTASTPTSMLANMSLSNNPNGGVFNFNAPNMNPPSSRSNSSVATTLPADSTNSSPAAVFYPLLSCSKELQDEIMKYRGYQASESEHSSGGYGRKFSLIQGAEFTGLFDHSSPIITTSSLLNTYYPHVRDVALYSTTSHNALSNCGCGLSVYVFDPVHQTGEWKDLGLNWVYQPVCPVGYLVSNNVSTQMIWYYIPRHPFEYIPSATATTIASSPIVPKTHSYTSLDECDMFDDTDVSTVVSYSGMQRLFARVNVIATEIFSYLTKNELWKKCFTLSKATHAMILQGFLSLQLPKNTWIPCPVTTSTAESTHTMNRKQALTKKSSVNDMTRDMFFQFLSQHPFGKYLTEGACKQVYHIQSMNNKASTTPSILQDYALSIMDLNDLHDRDYAYAIQQELCISFMTSMLTRLGNICGSYVQVHAMFECSFAIPANLWDDALVSSTVEAVSKQSAMQQYLSTVQKKSKKSGNGQYQYISMEYCSGGDVESYLRTQSTNWSLTTKNNQIVVLPQAKELLSWLFQMAYALYVGRDFLELIHYDIKLLNFFITTGDSLGTSPQKQQQSLPSTDNGMIVGLGNTLYRLPIQRSLPSVIKLADFGTSTIHSSQCIGDPINVQHFTTIENSPPEFFLLGNSCRISYASDTFNLGLCYLHLLTGFAPYEELLVDIHCPLFLAEQLQGLWNPCSVDEHGSSSHPYSIIQEVIESLISVDEEESSDDVKDSTATGKVFYDTFYRYLVLMSQSPNFLGNGFVSNPLYLHNPLHTLLLNIFSFGNNSTPVALPTPATTPRQRSKRSNHRSNSNTTTVPLTAYAAQLTSKGRKSLEECQTQFVQDSSLWSIHIGEHTIMKHVREKLKYLGKESEQLLETMLHWNPSSRCTMYDILLNPIFQQYFAIPSLPPIDDAKKDVIVQYLHYYTPSSSFSSSSSSSTNHWKEEESKYSQRSASFMMDHSLLPII